MDPVKLEVAPKQKNT